MSDFNPSPNDRVVIGGRAYQVMPHPSVPTFAFGQEGRKAFVYQLAAGTGEERRLYALKIFKVAYRVPELVDVCDALARFAQWPGLEVCDRQCLHAGAHDDALSRYPDMEFAVLMPWIGGSTWYDIVIGERPFNRMDALTFANATAQVLAALEESGLAHCDISAPNVIVNPALGRTYLIDVEDLYAPGFAPPRALPAGTAGYAHKSATEGLWQPDADRFAGAVLLAEMSAWHNPDIRKAADEEHYFGLGEIQQDCQRYQLMRATLEVLDPRLVELLDRAWFSDTLVDCPRLNEWYNVIHDAFHREQLSKVVSNWQPIAASVNATPDTGPARVTDEPIVPQEAQITSDSHQVRPGEGTPQAPPAAKPAVPIQPSVGLAPSLSPRPISPARATPFRTPGHTGAAGKLQPPAPSNPVREWRPLLIPSPTEEAHGNGSEPPTGDTFRPISTPSSSVPSDSMIPISETAHPPAGQPDPGGAPTSSDLIKPILDLSHVDSRNRPYLVWSESPSATHYVLQEATNPSFESPKEFKIRADETHWNPHWGRTGRLFYRVQARDGDEAGPWSEVLKVRISGS